MFRVIDLDSFTQNQDTQTIFSFLVGSERHGIPASELFELLKLRVVQNAAGKGAARKSTAQKRTAASDQMENSEFQSGPQSSDTPDDAAFASN